jgi:hypothetical protein
VSSVKRAKLGDSCAASMRVIAWLIFAIPALCESPDHLQEISATCLRSAVKMSCSLALFAYVLLNPL